MDISLVIPDIMTLNSNAPVERYHSFDVLITRIRVSERVSTVLVDIYMDFVYRVKLLKVVIIRNSEFIHMCLS